MEVEGSEEFVKEQVANFSELVKFAGLKQADRKGGGKKSNGSSGDEARASGAEDNPYENVLELKDSKVHIIADIPGTSDNEKTVSVALLHLLGSEMLGKEEVPTKEINIGGRLCESGSDQTQGLSEVMNVLSPGVENTARSRRIRCGVSA